MALNTNKERRECWEEINRSHSSEEIAKAMAALKQDTQTVIRLHYIYNMSLKDITQSINKSMTVIRTHQCMGIYKLWKYFQQEEKK
jgi:DNA-directed RNA polymerase specialized sigma24 family protein